MDVNAVIQNIITVSRNEWKYVAELETELEDSLPLAPGYRDKLGQVMLNLIVNVAHAIGDSVSNGVFEKGRITVCTRSLDGEVEIKVTDNGPGIPDAIQQKVFDPFFTTKSVGKGTGQGLSLAHSIIVKKHQGTIRFETETNKGTTFIIRLPLKADGLRRG